MFVVAVVVVVLLLFFFVCLFLFSVCVYLWFSEAIMYMKELSVVKLVQISF